MKSPKLITLRSKSRFTKSDFEKCLQSEEEKEEELLLEDLHYYDEFWREE